MAKVFFHGEFLPHGGKKKVGESNKMIFEITFYFFAIS
jgi:hypothetical protein